MSADAFVRAFDDPKYQVSIMYLNFKIHPLERLCLVKPLNITNIVVEQEI